MKAIDFINPKAKYRDKLFSRWTQMRSRCNDPSNPSYKNYGGRGIKVCDEWNNTRYGFIAYYAWAMQNGFKPKLSIERKNVNGNYEPNNCEWIPLKEQVHNRRCSIRIWDNGKYISMKTYCDIHKDTNDYQTCLNWIHKGIPPYIAIYFKADKKGYRGKWLDYHLHKLFYILLGIITDHPNLVDNKDMPIEQWIDTYLMGNCNDYTYDTKYIKSLKIWDTSKFISINDYCKKHTKTNPYKIVLNRIAVGIPPTIALYYKKKLSQEEYINLDIATILLEIFKNHPNLITPNDLPLEDYVKQYLKRYNEYNYTLWGNKSL